MREVDGVARSLSEDKITEMSVAQRSCHDRASCVLAIFSAWVRSNFATALYSLVAEESMRQLLARRSSAGIDHRFNG
jgi:hypothetical protein